MKFAVFVYSVPIDEGNEQPDSGVSSVELAASHLEEMIAREGVLREPYVLADEQVTMMEGYIATLEREHTEDNDGG